MSIDNRCVRVKRTDGKDEIFYPGYMLFKYSGRFTVRDSIVCYVTRNKINFEVATDEIIKKLESEGFEKANFDPPFSKDKVPEDEDLENNWKRLTKRASKLSPVHI